jgi:hypothetical protein
MYMNLFLLADSTLLSVMYLIALQFASCSQPKL